MTISTTSNEVVAQGNGLTTSFSFTFPVPMASELFVYYTDSTGAITLLQPNQYSVTGIGTSNGGAVTYPLIGSPIASGTSLTIQRIVPYVQLTDLVNQSGYYPNVVENALDYLTMQTQQLSQEVALSLQVPFSASVPNLVYPNAAGRANQLAGFDVNGNAITYPITASVGAGNLVSEGPFVAGTNFTPGVTTTLTLSKAYGTPANVQVHFDGTYQGTDQYSLNGTQITFTTPIPVGINKVYIVGGTTLSVAIPPNQSVGDAQLTWGNVLGRMCDSVSALQSLNPAIYTRAFVIGYYAPGDGGGGAYYYSPTSSATVNGGTVLTALGGVGRWLMSYQGQLSVKQFGAKGDGVTDDTSAMTNAHSTGLVIGYPAATFNFTTLSGTTGGIEGAGPQTVLNSTDTSTSDLITFSANNPQPGPASPIFSNFVLQGQLSKTTGSGIMVTAPSTENQGMQMSRVSVINTPSSVSFGRASNWNITNCKFINYQIAGVLVDNLNNPDSGDSAIIGCEMGSSVGASPVGILQRASGGLRVLGSKINGGAYGYLMGLAAPSSTSILLFSGNSVENMTTAAMSFSRSSGSANFSKIVITGNEFNINPNGIVTDTSGAFSDMNITGNTIGLSSTTTGNAISLSAVSEINIGPNTITGNGGTPNGIGIAATCSNGKILSQVFTNIAGAQRIVNSSTSVIYDEAPQTGGGISVTTGSAYGSALFTGTQAISFPVPFSVAPTSIDCTVNGSGGSIAAFAVNPTTTGFTMQVIGATNGGAVSGCSWSTVGGVI